MTDTAAHDDKLKAQMAFGYGGKESPTIEDRIDEQLGNQSTWRPWFITSFTLDALTRIAYGKEFGYLETDSDAHDYVSGADGPAVLRYTDFGLDSLLSDRARVHRAEAHRQKRDWALLSGMGVPRDVVEGEVPFQIFAGSDTTATAIRGIMLNLMTTPYAYQTLQKEIGTTISKDYISSPVGSHEGKQLEYLQAVIYEGLRPSTPFTGLIMKEVPPQGDTIHGHFVPVERGLPRVSWPSRDLKDCSVNVPTRTLARY
ncbi:putative Cytochrome P450 [Seiridium cardinale]|uniref:Cytochrome P450 n=1 Tax=Seiridium cardinale TaxID=138064 RepID=A0ABR2XN02_9PEZI